MLDTRCWMLDCRGGNDRRFLMDVATEAAAAVSDIGGTSLGNSCIVY